MVAGTKRKSNGVAPKAKRPRASKAASQSLGDAKLKFKSPAEFFAENKNIAGFDNPGKSLYTTIRELVENGLDAAEATGTLPEIGIVVERIGKQQFRALVGMDRGRERVDESLYKDVENGKERRKREAKEKKEARRKRAKESVSVVLPDESVDGKVSEGTEGLDSTQEATQQTSLSQLVELDEAAGDEAALLAMDPESSPPEMSQPTALPAPAVQQAPAKRGRSGRSEIFRVTVTDNGSGMAHDDVPNMMGRVLAGTKYCVRQTRGKFGLGSKMALIWSKMSTGLPVRVITAKAGCEITECVLDIDIARNTPNIIEHVQRENKARWNGSDVSVTIEGNWSTYRAKILMYVRQMAVITPYAQFRLKFVSGLPSGEGKDFELIFARRTDVMPRAAAEVKHHPSSVNQLLLKQLTNDVNKNMTLVRFLTTQFVSIPRTLATRLITELGSDFTSHMPVKDLSLNHIRQMDALLHAARFDKPNGVCLSPAGEYNLRLGITKELKPALVATHAEPADVFEGHPFIVEAGVALGGTVMKPGLNILRFANRIPLLFEAGSDVVTKTAREGIRWSNYKIHPSTERIAVICSIVSTKVPFKGTGKEYIGEDAESIKACVKRAITQCCSQLRAKLVRRAAQREAAQRKMLITKYAPDVANAVVSMFKELGDPQAESRDVADKVKEGKINHDILLAKLIEHVQQVDKEQAIEYAAAAGRGQKTVETVYVARRGSQSRYVPIWEEAAKAELAPNGVVAPAPPQVRLSLLTSLQCTL